jgi:hypothetical protein
MFKITALQNVKIYAHFSKRKITHIQEHIGQSKEKSKGFVNLRKGEVRDDIALLVGISPECLPQESTQEVDADLFLVPYRSGKVSPAFQALVQVEEVKD